MKLDEEITFLENLDHSEIVNMQVEKDSVYMKHNKIEANKLFSKYFEGYLERREKTGIKRMKLYGLRLERDK